MGAPRSSAEPDSSSDAQFSSQLRGLTQGQSETASQISVTSFLQQFAVGGTAIGLPRSATRPVDVARHTPTTSKQAAKTPRAQSASSQSTQTAPVTVVTPVPTPEIAATAAATAAESIDKEDLDIAVKAPATRIAPEKPEEPEESAPPAVTAAKPHAQPQEVAFATRVQPVQSTEHSALSAEMASTAAVASAGKKIVAAGDQGASSADPHALLATAATTVEPRGEPAATSLTAAPAGSATHSAQALAAHSAEAPADSLPKATTPLKDISLQVNQPGKERVDVRVVQQGSEVHVSVHSGDASLTSGLRQGLSELQSRLEESGYRTEMWRPTASSAPLAATPSAQESTNHSRGGDGQPQQGGSQQDSGRGSQNHSNQNQSNQNQSNQPRWVEELQSSFGEEKSSGGFNGFSS
jgi:hypothetical protein